MGGIDERDLGQKLTGTIQTSADGVSRLSTQVAMQADQIATKVSRETVDALGTRLASAESSILQTPEKIALAVGSVQIGGTNLLANGGPNGSDGWESAANIGTISLGTYAETFAAAPHAMAIVAKIPSGVYGGFANFHVRPLMAGRTYTVSGRIRCYEALNVNFGINGVPNVHFASYATDGTDRQIVHTFVAPADIAEPSFVCFAENTSTHEAWLYLHGVKVEEGNRATAWSECTDEFSTGSNVLIKQDEIRLISPKTVIGVPASDGSEEMVAQFDGDGVTAQEIICPRVARAYPYAAITIGEDTPDGEIHFRSLADALARISGCYIAQELAIHVPPAAQYYGDAVLKNCTGDAIIIDANNAHMSGQLLIRDVANRVQINGLNVASGAANRNAVQVNNCACVEYAGGTLDTPGGGCGIHLDRNANARVHDVTFTGFTSAIEAYLGTTITAYNNHGNCHYTLQGAVAHLWGTAPGGWVNVWYGSYAGGLADLTFEGENAGSGDSGSTQTTTALTASRVRTRIASTWYSVDNYLGQGYTSGGQRWGCLWFDTAALSGKTVQSATLTLTRMTGIGKSSAVNIHLWGTASTLAGQQVPAATVDYGVIGSLAQGAVAVMAIPVGAVNALMSGAIGGLCLYTGETANAAGKKYSSNCARFDAQPVLTVVSQ